MQYINAHTRIIKKRNKKFLSRKGTQLHLRERCITTESRGMIKRMSGAGKRKERKRKEEKNE